MSAKNVAVLTNDLQYDLVELTPARIAAVGEATPEFQLFLDGMRAAGANIVHLQLIILPEDPRGLYEGRRLAVKGTKGAEIITDFLDPSDIVLEKNKDSGFYETALDETLKRLGVDTLVVTGMQTQICVQTTAADAFFRGYNVWVPEDCVISARPEDKHRSLQWMDSYCATISSSHKILELLEKGEALPLKTGVVAY